MAARIFDHRRETNSPSPVAGSTSDPFPARLAICSTPGSIAPQFGARLSRLQHGSRFGSYRTDMPPIVVEFVIGGAGRSADECLETRVPPKLIGARCRNCGRNT